MSTKIFIGNSLEVLKTFRKKSIHCSVTSPPYFGLRRYSGNQECFWPSIEYEQLPGSPAISIPEWQGALGMEPDISMYVGHLVAIYREVWRVLRDDGVAWVVMGDSYNSSTQYNCHSGLREADRYTETKRGESWAGHRETIPGLKQLRISLWERCKSLNNHGDPDLSDIPEPDEIRDTQPIRLPGNYELYKIMQDKLGGDNILSGGEVYRSFEISHRQSYRWVKRWKKENRLL